MATITGKRFQMTDGAASPINLFPYTVSEAVYGLNNSISNAISSALSTISLSTYAGTSAIGSSTQPVYYNGTALVACNLSQTYAPYNAAGYLPLTGGTLTGGLTITAAGWAGQLSINRSNAGSVFASFNSQGTFWGGLGFSGANIPVLATTTGDVHTIWHANNSNLSTVPWACSTLTASGDATISGILRFGNLINNGDNIYHSSGSPVYLQGTGSGNVILAYGGGNVIIGSTTYTGYKLDVIGTGCFQASSGGDSLVLAKTSNYYPTLVFSGQTANATIEGGDNLLFYTNGSARLQILKHGNVGIGTTSPSQALHVVGNIFSTGDQIINSDLTMKTNLKDVTYSVSDIAKCRAVTFDWKDGHGHSAGSIAQDWKPLIPELVHGEEGGMTLAYGQIALVNSILEAREIERLKERVAELENQLKMRS